MYNIYGFVQDRYISIANALELRLSCTNSQMQQDDDKHRIKVELWTHKKDNPYISLAGELQSVFARKKLCYTKVQLWG